MIPQLGLATRGVASTGHHPVEALLTRNTAVRALDNSDPQIHAAGGDPTAATYPPSHPLPGNTAIQVALGDVGDVQ